MPMSEQSMYDKDRRTAEGRPTLEHRHYAVFANVIKTYVHRDIRTHVACRIADGLRTTNYKFNRARFLQACGVKDERQG